MDHSSNIVKQGLIHGKDMYIQGLKHAIDLFSLEDKEPPKILVLRLQKEQEELKEMKSE